MPASDAALAAFKSAWMAGESPDPGAFLAQVPPPEREELAELIDAWVALAPSPADDDAAVASSPALAALLVAYDAGHGPWGAVLPPLRAARAWSVRELAGRFAERVGLRGERAEEKAAAYLERMERGELAPGGVSRRALDALGELLGTSGTALAGAASAGVAPRAQPLFRAAAPPSTDFEALSEALRTPAPADWDEVDDLFCGGRG